MPKITEYSNLLPIPPKKKKIRIEKSAKSLVVPKPIFDTIYKLLCANLDYITIADKIADCHDC